MVTSNELQDRIAQELLSPEFLEQTGIHRDFIHEHIESTSFVNTLEDMISKNDYSSQKAYGLCKDALEKLWGEKAPSNPLNYIYQFALHFSFPNSVEIELHKELDAGALYYLYLLRAIASFEKLSQSNSITVRFPLNLLTDKEASIYKVSNEYYEFKKAFYNEYLYEMMKLNQDVMKYNTLDHICGVHHLALFVGRQLYEAGIPIDLGRVSGSAAGHDLGKFGCRSWEGNRVAYLHYYYTDLWFKNHGITHIGHVALNHSTWDLELENLSIESLILIYSDFRVKNIVDVHGKLEMTFFSLEDSFDVILSKLDNVDDAKEKRYRKVYNKLKDFEDYIQHLGIELDPFHPPSSFVTRKEYYALMKGNEITQHLKFLAISHNIHLMNHFKDEASLNEILEVIRGEKDPKNLREYMDVFKEYSTYLTQKQKIITLRFLYEKLITPEEDIRRQCAELMGNLIALFDEDYRKEIPQGVSLPPADISSFSLLEEYLQIFVSPHHTVIPLHRQWIGYTTKVLITAVFRYCKSIQIEGFKEVILKYYNPVFEYDTDIQICLLDVVGHIPLENDAPSLYTVFNYIESSYSSPLDALRIAGFKAATYLLPLIQQHEGLTSKLVNVLSAQDDRKKPPAENYLKCEILKGLNLGSDLIDQYETLCTQDLTEVSNLFLSNLKTATNWITKKIQVKMLLEYALKSNHNDGLYTAMHYCNLLKVSAVESVRNSAGKSLVSLIPHLPFEQRNDLAVELLRALELESYQFTKYIPDYLGQILLFLKPFELDEIIEDIRDKIKESNNQIKSLLLKTTGNLLNNYPKYRDKFREEPTIYGNRQKKLLGILFSGLAHDDFQIRQVSFSVLGKEVFGSDLLTLEEKYTLFQSMGKKILTLLADKEENQLLFLTNAAGLNHIYRFISDYSFHYSAISIHVPSRVALFPGTFDPFTLGHKEICKAIRDIGFEVYLAVDEFSWSKRTQPHLIRKNIIHMSIAEETDLYLYPEDFPTNIANPRDLQLLRINMNTDQVFIVVGLDVIINASAYKGDLEEYSVRRFPHIIFDRRDNLDVDQEDIFREALDRIENEVFSLNIPPQYEEISSTQIRNYIDKNRDISNLIDPLAQKYIYENNLYRREPQFKSMVQSISFNTDIATKADDALIEKLNTFFHGGSQNSLNNIKNILSKPDGQLVIISDANEDGMLLAYSAMHWVPSSQVYDEFKDVQVTEVIRDRYKGRIILLDGFFIAPQVQTSKDMNQVILTETVAHCLKMDYGYAIYKNNIQYRQNTAFIDTLQRNGFIPISQDTRSPILAVDMTNPCTLTLDLETIIKEPFRSNPAVRAVIHRTRGKLQKALTNLYPGNLVLSFDRELIDQALSKKICMENKVPPTPMVPRELGKLMCVPFGNILNRAIVPNTVTKSLHVEKLFKPDMKGFTVGPYPYYLDLEKQMKMIKSFNRPLILVDDLLNKGYRIKALDPLLKQEKIEVHKILVAILSGRGKELMDIQNREVDSAYFIPKLRLWFNENLLYPFIGGDTLWRGLYPEKNLISSINLILPYTSPHFIKGVTNRAVYDFSLVSIMNSMEILEVIEKEYQDFNERKLTLSLLSDVFLFPRYPDPGENMSYDLSINPSSYLKNDLELLKKLEHSIITGDRRRE